MIRRTIEDSFASESQPGKRHYAKLTTEDRTPVYAHCTCRGFSTHSHCWHLGDLALRIETEGRIVEPREVKKVTVDDLFVMGAA